MCTWFLFWNFSSHSSKTCRLGVWLMDTISIGLVWMWVWMLVGCSPDSSFLFHPTITEWWNVNRCIVSALPCCHFQTRLRVSWWWGAQCCLWEEWESDGLSPGVTARWCTEQWGCTSLRRICIWEGHSWNTNEWEVFACGCHDHITHTHTHVCVLTHCFFLIYHKYMTNLNPYLIWPRSCS